MKRVDLKINLSDRESEELVSWIAEKIIQYQDRRIVVKINNKVIVDQVNVKEAEEEIVHSRFAGHTGYTVESEGLGKNNGEMSEYPYTEGEL